MFASLAEIGVLLSSSIFEEERMGQFCKMMVTIFLSKITVRLFPIKATQYINIISEYAQTVHSYEPKV
jgi:hypothetical protein